MYAIILAGGSGTRLWPLSREDGDTKQFLKLYSENSLLQETYLRIKKIIPTQQIFFITSEGETAKKVFKQIKAVDDEISEEQIISEPEKMDTAPAIVMAVRHMLKNSKLNEEDQIIILPADHHIGDTDKYLKIVTMAMAENGNNIGTIGIVPTGPESGYGYIEIGEKIENYFRAISFKEKPTKSRARKYLQSGKYLWNSGMYIFNARTLFCELQKYAPEMYDVAIAVNDGDFMDKLKKIKPVSFDYAISEKSDKVMVIPGNFGWDDIGSFDSLSTVSNGEDNHILIDSKNVIVYGLGNKRISLIGVRDLIVVYSGDDILILKRGHSEKVKKVTQILKSNKKEG